MNDLAACGMAELAQRGLNGTRRKAAVAAVPWPAAFTLPLLFVPRWGPRIGRRPVSPPFDLAEAPFDHALCLCQRAGSNCDDLWCCRAIHDCPSVIGGHNDPHEMSTNRSVACRPLRSSFGSATSPYTAGCRHTVSPLSSSMLAVVERPGHGTGRHRGEVEGETNGRRGCAARSGRAAPLGGRCRLRAPAANGGALRHA